MCLKHLLGDRVNSSDHRLARQVFGAFEFQAVLVSNQSASDALLGLRGKYVGIYDQFLADLVEEALLRSGRQYSRQFL